jgi:hypothetical protein
MHRFSFINVFTFGLLVAAPLASAYIDVEATADLTKKGFVVSVLNRNHVEVVMSNSQ